jgi:hypothetical protein
MPPETAAAHPTSFLGTQRRDLWWVEPAIVFTILTAFVVYATFRVLEGNTVATRYFEADNGDYHYLSPFGTPDLTFLVPAFLRDLVAGLPVVGAFGLALLTNPAFLILPVPAGFRFTCYYYRKSYYRAFAARPAACGVEATKGKKYKGERGLMVVQNIHRYFLYLAILVTVFLAYDAVRGIWTPHGLYFGLGNAIMVANVVLLMAFTFGCNSFRHLVGGGIDCYSCDALSQTRYTWWQYVTRLNQKHALWAMASLFSVALTDIYIRWVAQSGATHIFGVPV